MTVLDYLKSLYAQSQGQNQSFAMPPQNASLYGDQTQMDPTSPQGQPAPTAPMAPMSQPPMGQMPVPMTQAAIPGATAAPVGDPTRKGILDYLRDPGAGDTLLSFGSALMQAGGPSDKPVSFGQALAGGINAGMSTSQNFQDRQDAMAARKQALAAQQWTTLSPQDAAKVVPGGIAPGYVAQKNGAGEIRVVGQDVIKNGTDANGAPTQIDTRKLGQGAAKPASGTQGPLDQSTLDTATVVVMSDPDKMRQYATFGKVGQAIRNQINASISQNLKDAGMTAQEMVALRTRAHAQAGNVATLTKQQAQVNAADQLVHANGDRLLQLFDMVDQTGIPMIEGFTRSARAKAGGVDPAELQSVLTTFQTEVARMLSANPNMSGVISDSMRDEIMKMAPGSMSTDQAKRIINRLYLETGIRQQAIQQQLDKGVQGTVVSGQPATPAPSASGWSISPVP